MTEQNFTHEFFATSSVQDFKYKNVGEAPPGYPLETVPDSYTKYSFADDYEVRKSVFLEHVLKNPGVDTIKGLFYELIRIEQGHGPIHEGMLLAALDYINGRYDCADFVLAGILRLQYQLIDSDLVTDVFRSKAKQTVLDFKYWPDEPGIDSMCYWTENHHIIFSSCEYLAGQLFPDDVFTNSGMTGKEKQVKAKARLEKWLELRFYTGFNEWLSNVYYDENFPALLNLVDFAADKDIAKQATNVVDLMLYDMSINSYYGLFACTHGRTYTKEKTQPFLESTTDTAKLLFGIGTFANEDNMSAVMFALSKNYSLPKVIYDLANSTANGELETKQRVSIKFSDAKKWGYGKMNLESAMGLLSFGGYSHHRTFNHLVLMLDKFNWWDNQFFLELAPFKKIIQIGKYIKLTNLIAWIMRKDYSRNALEENNIYTYRTPDYMLSTSQEYRKGYGGDQHHIWQATLDGGAVCFTTHPGGYGMKAPDAYWHGNGFMPKAVQYKNVAVIIYNTPTMPTVALSQTLKFTHAFFPQQRFDQVLKKGPWLFAKKNDGYIALYSQNPGEWQTDGEYAKQDLVVQGKKNIWLVEMGRSDDFGSFENFVEQISASSIVCDGLNVNFESPSLGSVETGWSKPLKVAGELIQTNDYKRYENDSCVANFETDQISIDYNDQSHLVSYR